MATQKDFRVKNGIIVGDSADISNDLTVNSDTLYVDSANGRVGVGTTSPSDTLDVSGSVTATSFSGDGSGLGSVNADQLDGKDASDFLLNSGFELHSGSLEITNFLDVGGDVDIDGELNVNNSNLKVEESSVGINTNTPNGVLDVNSFDNQLEVHLRHRQNGETISIFLEEDSGSYGTSIRSIFGNMYLFTEGTVGVNGIIDTTESLEVVGNIALTGTVDGRDVASDGSKLDTIESSADVTDTANVTGAGALMDSELTNESAIKNIDQELTTTDSPTFSGITTSGGDLTVDQAKLKEIAESKSDSPVDVFVYDTSRDSDGGAWRHRTQHTSWYNEDLNTSDRGSRREFPSVAVIVAESDKVTIYDGDDPALPMWMVFNADNDRMVRFSPVAISIVNGLLSVGMNNNRGTSLINFISDSHFLRGSRIFGLNQNIAQRNIDSTFIILDEEGGIVSSEVNDVAMTVLPGAPIDEATGLPVPTIAVATDGGVSVIKDDGTVVDSGVTNATNVVAFVDNGIWFHFNGRVYFADYSTLSSDGFGNLVGRSIAGDFDFDILADFKKLTSAGDDIVYGGVSSGQPSLSFVAGFARFYPDYSDFAKGMSALVTSTYNTGWMNGDIKLAALSDTDDTDLVESGELITNGEDWTGASGNTPPNGWIKAGNLTQYTITQDGALEIDRNGDGSGDTRQTFSTVEGKKYILSFDIISTGGGSILIGLVSNTVQLPGFSTLISSTGKKFFTFTATSSDARFEVRPTSTNQVIEIDNVSVKLADNDRSVNNNGLIVNGTVTREPVAPGADLVAYSGFTSGDFTGNRLEQPYNSELSVGSGDYSISFWCKDVGTSTDVMGIGERQVDLTWNLYHDFNGGLRLTVSSDGSDFTAPVEIQFGGGIQDWTHVVYVKSGSTYLAYRNGVLNVSGTGPSTLNDSNRPFIIGSGATNNEINGDPKYALLRISATAPTPEQIKRIYEDEKFLFQENAQATLYGNSDAVTALAHDEVTDLLHVGTSDGRSVFQGLRRVDNTTTGVNVIDAHDSMIIEG